MPGCEQGAVMRRSTASRIIGTALIVEIGLIICTGTATARRAQATKPTPPKTETKRMSIGDVRISGYSVFRAAPGFKGVRLTGSKTLIVVPDKKTGSTLRLHADDIETQKEQNDTFAVIQLRGNVRFTITRQTETGTIRVEGTAPQGVY